MSNPRKFDTCTIDEVDWGFVENAELMAGIDKFVAIQAPKHDLDPDDLRQECYGYLCCRPALQKESKDGILWMLRNVVNREVAVEAHYEGGLDVEGL